MSNIEAAVFPDGIDLTTWFNPEYLNFRRPEVTRFLGSLSFNPEIENGICTVERAKELLEEGGFTHSASLEYDSKDGAIDMSRLHLPITAKIAKRDEVLLPGLFEGFKNRYATVNGATDAIDQLLVGLHAEGKMGKVGLLKGDYLGYLGASHYKGIPIKWIDTLEDAGEPDDDVVFLVSNPSSINGNLQEHDVWSAFIDRHKTVVDAVHIDTTVDGSVDVSHENIIGVVTGPSKPYGFVHDKYPGILYLKEKLGDPFVHRKFKNVPRLFTILEVQLQEQFEPHKIAQLHRPIQLEICRDLSSIVDGEVLPSDATLMAHARGRLHPDFEPYKKVNEHQRDKDYTFRLTKEFARRALLERQG